MSGIWIATRPGKSGRICGRENWGYDARNKLVQARAFSPWSPGWQQTYNYPVVYVSWNDATAFCNWLSEKEGRTYQLPSEAEWAYACQAGRRAYFGVLTG